MMIWSMDQRKFLRRFASQAALLSTACMLATLLTAPLAVAQQQPAMPKARATQQPQGQAQPAPAGGAQAPAAQAVVGVTAPEGGWVKLCSKNEHTENKEFCLTSLEVWDVSSGILMGSTGVRQIEGEQGLHLLVSLTTSYSIMIPKGLHLTVDKGKPVPMPFSFCVPLFCQTQIELTKELLDSLRSGKEIVVSGDSVQGRPIGFRAPLNGFSKAHDGIPLDPALYQEAQRRLKEMIRKRQIELANRTVEAQQKKEQGQQPEGQLQPGAQAPAQPAPNGTAAQQKKPDIQVNP